MPINFKLPGRKIIFSKSYLLEFRCDYPIVFVHLGIEDIISPMFAQAAS